MSTGVLCGLVAVIFVFLLRRYKLKKSLCKIPNPPGHWLFGNLPLNNPNSGELFNQLRNYARDYGPIYKISVPFLDIVNFFHPNDLEVTRKIANPKIVLSAVSDYTITKKAHEEEFVVSVS